MLAAGHSGDQVRSGEAVRTILQALEPAVRADAAQREGRQDG